MRAPDNLARKGVGFNMTPMIDVVFLLIIFFLVSSNLAQQETQMELDLPEAMSGERVQEDEQRRRIVINVVGEGDIQIGARRVDAKQLESMLLFERERSERPVEVRIRTNRNVPYRTVEPILVACAKAGVWNVSFSVLRERG